MEIDLNHAVDGEKGEGGNGSSSSFCSSAPCSLFATSSIYMELWHACAGPLTNFPKKGNLVVYFPQGHLEQLNPSMVAPNFDLPPQILCRVVDVQLLADKESDEVYTQLTLLPLPEKVGVKLEGKVEENEGLDDDDNGEALMKSTTHMFCKTLTASDTCTHGGFSVPRRAAEDCFPPLNYKEQRPSQELIATDLHGVEWKFRHIYRGQPRRHLLTTGWSTFVSQKNLASRDAVLFLRGEAGDLRLGVRRAARSTNGLPDSVITNQNSYPNVLLPVANALTNNGMFNVFYSPRASHSDFVVPYQKYLKCITYPVSAGTRFKMQFELDDSPERRFSGVVTGVNDADPYSWPNSKWRCLMVRWDDTCNQQERVSPWDVHFSSNYAPPSIQTSLRMKRLRPNLESSPHSSSISKLDFGEYVRSSKVLQGQEIVGSPSPLYRSDRLTCYPGFVMPIKVPNGTGKFNDGGRNQGHTTFTGFLESNWFPKVLQGQEICSLSSLPGKTDWNLGAWSKALLDSDLYNASRFPTPSCYPLASKGARNMSFPLKAIYRAGQCPPMQSRLSNVNTGNHVLTPRSSQNVVTSDVGKAVKSMNNEKDPICKLFGYSLTKDPAILDSQAQTKRSCTKVHKQGSLVGRAVDLSRLRGYDDLITELERLFSMEGLIRDPSHGWRTLYSDNESEMMVVGDDPWNEFIEVVSKIHIYTQEEVEKMNLEMNSDDTQSCLEELRPVI